MFFKQFGGKLTDELLDQYKQSNNWKEGCFQNLEFTDQSMGMGKLARIIFKQLAHRGGAPPEPLPIQAFSKPDFLTDSGASQLIWYGHSVVLMRMQGKTILIDPMLGPDTTPIAPVSNKRFSENTLALIDAFPEIDLLLLTHDHYDHLDYASIQKLKTKTRHYFVALGVKRHLVHWGVRADLITEFDWWDRKQFGEITISFTPTRHFSGRGLKDRLKSFWGGWAFKTAEENIWFSGDGGYGAHFKEIGQRLGPFDFGFMECGQYNDEWRPIHLFPDECIVAAKDAGVQKAMPVHWAGFSLSFQHTWSEPGEQFVEAAIKNEMDYILPRLGQQFDLATNATEKWW